MAITAGIEDFPGPDEVEGFWAFDNHMTAPMTPLSQGAICETIAAGFTKAQAEYDCPMVVDAMFPNGFFYASFHPHEDEAVLADRMSRYLETVDSLTPGVGARWQEEWKPEVMATNLPLRTRDWSTLNDRDLAEQLDWFVEQMLHQWYIHGHINFCLIPTAAFVDMYDEVMQPDDKTEAYLCLQGHRTMSVDTSVGLWKLSRMIGGDPQLKALFESTAPDRLMAELTASESAGASAFLAAFDEFLSEFGWRSGGVYDMVAPTWIEDPSVPLQTLAGYIDHGEDQNPEHHLERSIARREELLAGARAKLADEPERLARFNALYEGAQWNLPVTEDHAFWIDQTYVAVFRRFIAEVGRRLVESGVLTQPEDAHFLYLDELKAVMADPSDRSADVAQRRASWEAYCQITPPPILGTPPPPPPADAPPDPFMDALVVRLLGQVPPDPDAEVKEDELTGVAGSAGTATGRARVVTSLEEAAELEHDEILVCPMTLPPWVPLFSIAAGVVADTGGTLSHCAIVAREFGIPAVVGTQVGTTTIQTGQLITVDGNAGVVYLNVEA
jgi:pyruvate,water dikinase